MTHDYTNKKEVAYSEIILCENAPREYADRETLWNAVGEVEKQSNARLAREWEVALPNKLTFEQGKELTLAISVFFADVIRAVIPINLLLLLIITHVLYVGVRWYIKGCRQSRGYY